MNIQKKFTKLCDPAKFYLVFSLLATVMYVVHIVQRKTHYTVMGGVVQLAMVAVWTLILNWVCSLKYGTQLSWFLVFLPFIFAVLVVGVMFTLIKDAKKEEDCDECKA